MLCQVGEQGNSIPEEVFDILRDMAGEDEESELRPQDEVEPPEETEAEDTYRDDHPDQPGRRQKRFIENPDKLWRAGIVPYTFKSKLSNALDTFCIV